MIIINRYKIDQGASPLELLRLPPANKLCVEGWKKEQVIDNYPCPLEVRVVQQHDEHILR
jgi:hypothetical protein